MGAATRSVTRRAMSWALRPACASTLARAPCSGNSGGIPKVSAGVPTPASSRALRIAVPTPPARILSSSTTTRSASAARPASRVGIGSAHRGSTTVVLMPCAANASATSSPSEAKAPTATMRTSQVSDSRRTSTPSIRRTATMSSGTVPLGNRTTVGASETDTASRSCSRREAASRGAARRRPGTTPRSDMSQMPL